MSDSKLPAGQTRRFHVSPALGLSPCDERCLAGNVTITLDGGGGHVETSGESFTLRPRSRTHLCARPNVHERRLARRRAQP